MTTFGRYEILDKIGEGAMGVVYRARDSALGRVVALKMLSAELGAEEELLQRFKREAEAIGRLSHPNIVTVYDLAPSSDAQLYMAMELLDGGDLRSFIEKGVHVPMADLVRILIQICDGLAYAHSRGVVHRDIKPANIMITAGGDVKLLDFGLARVATRATITRRGVILGTPDYMSPEQAMGKPVDPRSDMFSAGAVFYEFLTAQKPFKGKTLHSVLYQIVSEEPDAVLTLTPEVPARLAAVVHGMLQKDPMKRFPSMDEVGRLLREIHGGLRRSQSRSALPRAAAPPPTEEVRNRVRDLLARGRSHVDEGRINRALATMDEALALDPESDEAIEIAWRARRKQQGDRPEPERVDPVNEKRVVALLAKVGPGSSDSEVRAALAELALIAPDDNRVSDLLRERAGKDR